MTEMLLAALKPPPQDRMGPTLFIPDESVLKRYIDVRHVMMNTVRIGKLFILLPEVKR